MWDSAASEIVFDNYILKINYSETVFKKLV